MSIVNMTYRDIKIGDRVFPACSHDVPRITEFEPVQFGIVDGVPIFRKNVRVTYLPEQKDGVYIIVSDDVAKTFPREDMLIFDGERLVKVKIEE